MNKERIVGVYGSAHGNSIEINKERAKEIGRELAKNNISVVSGACNGLPHEAIRAANQNGAKTIGFSPYISLDLHKKGNAPTDSFSKIKFIREDYEYSHDLHICQKYRNVLSVAYSHAGIFISGRAGTLNEFTIAYDLGKVIGILEGSGGVCDSEIKTFIQNTDKKTKGKVIFEKDIKKLVKKVLDEVDEI